ncbi:hypothetical protein N6H18_11755 [Reichenbachiella agarivorans]|uniref:Lipoprotein n=1 Tax=Reichenbachiella agarivorans TaxID=2979464 RepID=A0ABY6CKU6_9BACT|nr:hypothetical protein [Reichenbachiella agarivorans]UXP31024.1 hypothetical protein N6H18_11755 [Reichenbachiella agarivorans]
MKSFSKTALMIALLGSAVFVSSCSKDDDGGSSWTDAEIAEANASCVADGDDEATCDCFISKVSDEFSYKEYKEFTEDEDGADDDDAAKLFTFYFACAGE